MSQRLACAYVWCVYYPKANCLMAFNEYAGLIMSIRVNGKSILSYNGLKASKCLLLFSLSLCWRPFFFPFSFLHLTLNLWSLVVSPPQISPSPPLLWTFSHSVTLILWEQTSAAVLIINVGAKQSNIQTDNMATAKYLSRSRPKPWSKELTCWPTASSTASF